MKRIFLSMASLAILSTGALLVSCDWSGGGGDGFNTSRQNLNVNLSGVYRGQLDGGKAVANPSGGTINQLIMSQSGDVLELTDNQGSTYRGRAGTPFVTTSEATTTIPAGTELASYIVAFEGMDRISNRNIRFTGNIELVSVTDVDSQDEVTTVVNNRDTEAVNTVNRGVDGSVTTTGEAINNNGIQNNSDLQNNSTTTTTTTMQTGGTQQGNFGETETDMTTLTTVNTVQNNAGTTAGNNVQNNNSVNTSVVQTDVNTTQNTDTITSMDNVTTTGIRSFAISPTTFQHRLRGSWIEENGTISEVDALAPSAGGLFTIPIGGGVGGFGGTDGGTAAGGTDGAAQ